MTVINLDNDERFKVNQVNVKFDGKEYSVVADDDTINKIAANVKALFANAKKYDDSTKKFESAEVDNLSSDEMNDEMNKTLDETIDFSAKQRSTLIKAINSLFGSDLGDLIYEKWNITKVLSDFYDKVIDELYEAKANSQHEKIKKLVKKANNVK